MAEKRMSKKAFKVMKGIARVLRGICRTKRGMAGLIILTFYVAIAIFAPFLTPYDPVKDWHVSGVRAKPAWFITLGIDANLSTNLDPIKGGQFNGAELQRYWTNASTSDSVTIGHTTAEAYRGGSAIFNFTRRTGEESHGFVTANLTQEFHYPFNGPPERLNIKFSFLVEATKVVDGFTFDVPIDMRVFLTRVTENETKRFDIWPRPYFDPRLKRDYEVVRAKYDIIYKDVFELKLGENPGQREPRVFSRHNVSDWVYVDYIDSSSPFLLFLDRGARGQVLQHVNRDLFSGSAKFYLGVEIKFNDTKPVAPSDFKTVVYVDTLDLSIRGNAHGLLGTDHYGRDIFSQFVYGARLSLIVGILAAGVGVSLGLFVGLIAAYMGGVIDEALMRFADLLIVIPGLPLLIVLVAVLGPGIVNLILVLGFLGWMGFSRLVRSQVLSLKERAFVESAKAIGASKIYIMTRHIIPNVMSLVWVSLATSVPGAILSESALSFLGFFDPFVMSWGRMLHDVTTVTGAVTSWWWLFPPGLSIGLIAMAFIMLGFSLDEYLNPKIRQRR